MICYPRCFTPSLLAVAAMFFVDPARASAELAIDLEVAVAPSAPFGATQEWGKLLSGMDLARLRLRSAKRGDEPSITPPAAGAGQRFRVVGVVNHNDQLVLPGAVFRQGDAARLKQFFERLPQQLAEQGVERGIFGLTRPQFETLYHDLAPRVATSTKNVPLESVVAAIMAQVKTPVQTTDRAVELLRRAPPVAVELQGFSAGTALSLALRQAGLELVPTGPTLDTVALRIDRATREPDHWPVGWKPAQVARIVAPAMHQFTTVEISGFTLRQALDGGLAEHMGVPLVFDQRTLAERNIDPAAVQVKFPRSKTYIRRAVDSILSQARLAGELRVDEADKPFYWITQFGPDSPRAQGAEAPPADAQSPSLEGRGQGRD